MHCREMYDKLQYQKKRWPHAVADYSPYRTFRCYVNIKAYWVNWDNFRRQVACFRLIQHQSTEVRKITSDHIFLFPNCLSFKRDMIFHYNKLESHSPRNGLCQVCMKLANWFGKEDKIVKSLRQQQKQQKHW